MNYTNEFLARVYGAYMGCDVEYQGRDGRPDKYFIDTTKDDYNFQFRLSGFKGQDVFGDIILNTGELISDEAEADVKDCKLLLTLLSEITDEDAIEVASRQYDDAARFDRDYLVYEGRLIVNEGTGEYHKQHLLHCYKDMVDYLRSKGYDCGYGEIPSLIDAGIAIKQTTNK